MPRSWNCAGTRSCASTSRAISVRKGRASFAVWPPLHPPWAAPGVARWTASPRRPAACSVRSWLGFDEGYEEVWLIVTDLAPAQATALWYGMRSWVEGGENRYQAGWVGLGPDPDGGFRAGRTL